MHAKKNKWFCSENVCQGQKAKLRDLYALRIRQFLHLHTDFIPFIHELRVYAPLTYTILLNFFNQKHANFV